MLRPHYLLAVCLLVLLGATTSCSSRHPVSHASASPSSAGAQQTQQTVDGLLGTAQQQIRAQRLEPARTTLEKARALSPQNKYVLYNLGYIAQQQGDAGTASQDYVAAIDQDGRFAPALYNLAILTEGKDATAAAALYRRVLEVKPDDAASHLRLGFALAHLGSSSAAQQQRQRALRLDPSLASVKAPAYR